MGILVLLVLCPFTSKQSLIFLILFQKEITMIRVLGC